MKILLKDTTNKQQQKKKFKKNFKHEIRSF